MLCLHRRMTRRLAYFVYQGGPDVDPFSSEVSQEELQECNRWQQMSAAAVIDALLAEHVLSVAEMTRRRHLQAVLDAHGVHFSAAQLVGIAASPWAQTLLRRQEPIAHLRQPIRVAINFRVDVLRSFQDGIAAKRALASSNKRTPSIKDNCLLITQCYRLFSSVEAAAEWHDCFLFCAFGTCAPPAPRAIAPGMHGHSALLYVLQ